MVLIQEYPLCKNSLELEMYELHHCDAYEPDLNARRPCLTDEDRKDYKLAYYNDNKAVYLKRSKDFYHNNKELFIYWIIDILLFLIITIAFMVCFSFYEISGRSNVMCYVILYYSINN